MPVTALERMVLRSGQSATNYRANSKVGTILRASGIRRTAEFQRIAALPRRDWPKLSEDGYLEALSAHLRVPGSSALLRAAQVALLTEAHDLRGAVGQLGLGVGKTLITAVAPTLLNAQRPVLLAPAKLRRKTARDFEKLRLDWLVHPRIEFISYHQLGLDKNANLLDEINPDLILCDEVQALKNFGAARTRRVARFVYSHKPMWIGMSATMTKKSLMDFWHFLLWGLGPDAMPLPSTDEEAEEWGLAVDEKAEETRRIAPGALLDFGPDLDPLLDPRSRARLGLQRRLIETPGFVITKNAEVDASLTIEMIRPPRSRVIEEALRECRESRQTPNGDELIQPTDVWRNARQLAMGFYYRWTPPAPPHWITARANWAKYVRYIIGESNKYDSPLSVMNAVKQGKLMVPFRLEHPSKPNAYILVKPATLLERWLSVRADFTPAPKAYWIDDSPLRWVLKKHVFAPKIEPTIIWVEHVAVGTKLAQLSGLPYCRKDASDQQGRYIEDIQGHVIASIGSCGEGVNLQKNWARNIIMSCLPDGRTYEQLIGRTHRSGQEADSVEVLHFMSSPEQKEGFEQAVREATYAFETFGQEQRLLLADRV